MTSTSTSSYKGWHAKAILDPHRHPHEFTPSASALSLVVLANSQVEPEGFTFALFNPTIPDPHRRDDSTIGVDAQGRVLHIPLDLFAHLDNLAKDVKTLPETGNFRNQWRVKHEVTCRGIDRLLVNQGDSGKLDLKETSVYGFDGKRVELEESVGGHRDLPEGLRELFGLVLEAREGYDRGSADRTVIDKVKKELGVE